MLPKAQACRSSLISTLVLYTSFCTLVLSATIVVDDHDITLSVKWDGSWTRWVKLDEDAGSFDGTLTSTNQLGANVTFTFTGTSIQVFGALQPRGTWNMRSQYYVDDAERLAMFSRPQPINENAVRQQFYDSGPLPAGKHTLTVINMGEQLWLDYFQYEADTVPPVTHKSIPAGPTSVTMTSTKRASSATITTRSLSSTSTEDNGGGSTTLTSSISFQFSTSISISTTTFALPPAVASSPTVNLSLSAPPLPLSSSSTSSSNASAPSQGAEISPPHAHVMSHGELVGITAATIVGVALLAILLWLARRYNRQTRSRLRASMSSDYVPITSDRSHGNPFRNSQYSTTLSIGATPDTGVTYLAAAAWRGDIVHQCPYWLRTTASSRRSMDGGVSIAGGPGVSHADAPSISDAASEKSTLPPSYQTHDAP